MPEYGYEGKHIVATLDIGGPVWPVPRWVPATRPDLRGGRIGWLWFAVGLAVRKHNGGDDDE